MPKSALNLLLSWRGQNFRNVVRDCFVRREFWEIAQMTGHAVATRRKQQENELQVNDESAWEVIGHKWVKISKLRTLTSDIKLTIFDSQHRVLMQELVASALNNSSFGLCGIT